MVYQGTVFAGDDGEPDEPRSAGRLLQAIKHAEKKLDPWQTKADRIDKLYANLNSWGAYSQSDSFSDKEFNLFWASMEVIKPSIYSRPPVPVVTPVFKDRRPVVRTASEMLERCAVTGFQIADMDQVMLGVRDDLAINSRGVIWVTYETGDDAGPYKEMACPEHLDRKDFLHGPARKWVDVPWVARRAWLYPFEAKERFEKHSGDLYLNANYGQHKDDRNDTDEGLDGQAGFWEVWHKVDKKVYWVSDGCDDFLDKGPPHLKLKRFFPCPKPAYGTLERRSLNPIPDIVYIEDQLESINELTSRIHGLCERLVVRGIIPAGSDIGDAIDLAFSQTDADHMMIPVPAAAFSTANKYVDWLPIDMVAQAILSAVEARRELIGNVQELFGIADIMRGETEAQETLGAQKLKAQYGSVRIRDKISELVRIARETVQIMSEIQAEEFDFDTLLEMSHMEIPTKAETTKGIKALEAAAKNELKALAEKAEEMAQSPEAQENAEAAQQQFQQMQQQIIAKYQPELEKLRTTVTQEDIKELLSEQKTGFADFDIQTDSTIYPDEQAEKSSRNEFLGVFATASQALAAMVQTGGEGAETAGVLLKFVLGPYRAGREVDAAIDGWIDSIKNAPPQEQGGEEKALVEAQNKLAEAEIQKAKAATMSVEARAAFENQKLQAKMFEMQQKAANDEQKAQLEVATLQGKLAEQEAKVNLLQAQTAEILSKIGLDVRKQDLEEYKTTNDVQVKANQEARSDLQLQNQAQESEFDREQRLRGEDRQDRSQSLTEQQMQQGNNDGV